MGIQGFPRLPVRDKDTKNILYECLYGNKLLFLMSKYLGA